LLCYVALFPSAAVTAVLLCLTPQGSGSDGMVKKK